jgi:hypothetical protein
MTVVVMVMIIIITNTIIEYDDVVLYGAVASSDVISLTDLLTD